MIPGVLTSPYLDQEENKLGSMSGTRAISTTSRSELSSSSFFFLQGKAPKEIHAILTETLACFLPGRAKDLSAPLYNDTDRQRQKTGSETFSRAIWSTIAPATLLLQQTGWLLGHCAVLPTCKRYLCFETHVSRGAPHVPASPHHT